MRFGDYLRKRRLAANLTYKQLADRIGASSCSIATWERGGIAPGIVFLKQLSVALGTPLADIWDCTFPADHRRKTTVGA